MLNYAPDLDPQTPDIIIACDGFVPSVKGYAALNSTADETTALGGEIRGLYASRKLDGTYRLFAGQATSIQEWGGSSWTSRGTYTTHTDNWQFETFGNVSLAARIDQKIQASTTGSFADVDASAPKAKFIAAAGGFVMAGYYNNGSAVEDGWYCSALYDHTDWTASVATQSANGRLLETPGAITGVFALGNDFIFAKRGSLYHARYVGPPIIWQVSLISSSIGCSAARGAIDIGGRLIFVDEKDIYSYDGSSLPVSIADGIREYWRGRVNNSYLNKTIVSLDPINTRVYIHFVSTDTAGSIPDRYLCWNYRSGRWGEGSLTVENGVTRQDDVPLGYGDGSLLYATYDDLPAGITYDSSIWTATSGVGMLVAGSDHKVKSLTGTPGTASMTTGDKGDFDRFSLFRRVKPRYITQPTSATLIPYSKQFMDDSHTAGSEVTQDSRQRFDFMQSGRYHRAKFTSVGNCELTDLPFNLVGQGVE